MSTALLTTWNRNRSLQGPMVIEESEYDGSQLRAEEQAHIGFFNGAASMYRNYIHNSGSGIGLQGTYEATGADIVIQSNVVDHLIAYGDPSGSGNHQSAFTVRDVDTSMRDDRPLLVTDNSFTCDGANATGALFIQPNSEDVRKVTVQGSLLAGRSFMLILEDDQGAAPA